MIDSRIESVNIPYAIRIDGRFSRMHTRSVPCQEHPYPRLVEVARNQPEFHFDDISGTLVGFRLPEYMATVNVAGYHLHFLDDDKTVGGHLLDFVLDEGILYLEPKRKFVMLLPEHEGFGSVRLDEDLSEELHEVERGRAAY